MRARANPHTRLVSLGSAGLVPVGLPVRVLVVVVSGCQRLQLRQGQLIGCGGACGGTSAPSGRGSAYCNSVKASGCDGVCGGASSAVSGCGSACNSSYSIKKGCAEASATHLTEHLL